MNTQHLFVETMAHIPPAFALEDLTDAQAHARLPNTPHSIAEIVAHMDFWQRWFLKRCDGIAEPMVQSAADGWPAVVGAWPELRTGFVEGLQRAATLGADGEVLRRPITPAIEMPPMAEYFIVDVLAHLAIHNSHHLGQIVTLRQIAGWWPPPSGSWTF